MKTLKGLLFAEPTPHTTKVRQTIQMAQQQIEIVGDQIECQDACMKFMDYHNDRVKKAWGKGLMTTQTPKTSYPNLFDYGK